MNVDIKVHGAEHAADNYEAVGRRLLDAHGGWARVLPVLEEGEKRHFARQKGRYVDSRRLLASLTQPDALDAIREAHGGGLVFGTSTYYANFLTKRRKDPAGGQVSGRKGKSAVLVLQPKTRRQVSQTLLDYVTEPFGEDVDPLAAHRV